MTVVALAPLSAGGVRVDPPTTTEREPTAAIVPAAIAAASSPHLADEPTHDLAVHVVDGGLPIAGATVSLGDGRLPVSATAITDREGIAHFAHLAPRPYEVWARAERDGHARVSVLARIADPTERTSPVELALAPAATIHGQLSRQQAPTPNAGIAAFADASVALIPIDVDHAIRVAPVEASGRFAIAGLPAGTWRVEASATGYVQPSEQTIRIAGGDAGDAADIDVGVALARTGEVSGRVADGDGTPIAGATIVLHSLGASTSRARSGSDTSIATVRWVHPFAGHRALPARDILRFGAHRSGTRPAECGLGHCGVDLGAPRGTVIHAAADGEIAIAFFEPHGEAGRAIAIDHGGGLRTYYMHLDELRPGIEVGRHVRAGEAIGTVGATGRAEGPHLHFAMTENRGGRTWYVDPEPVLHYAIVLPAPRSIDPLPPLAPSERDRVVATTMSTNVSTIVTDGEGKFRVDNVAPGSYVALAVAPGLAPGTSARFAIASGELASAGAIALHPGVIVRGRVTADGVAVAGARVVAGTGSGEDVHQVAATTTDARGEYVLRTLSGTIALAVRGGGYGEAEREVELGDGARARESRREDFALVVERATLRGQVLAPDGGPASGAEVRVVAGPSRHRAVTDARGRFEVRAAAGAYTLEIRSRDYPTTRLSTHADHWTEIRLPQGGAVRCDVRDRMNAAGLTARVEATGPGRASATTDADGTITLRGLVPGEWTIRAIAPGYTGPAQTVVVRPTRLPADLRFELSRATTLAGVVRDGRGQRVANARVFVGGVETRTDGDGNFELAGAPSGRFWLGAEGPGETGGVELSIAPGEHRMSIELEID